VNGIEPTNSSALLYTFTTALVIACLAMNRKVVEPPGSTGLG
jgi:hypothetical protein